MYSSINREIKESDVYPVIELLTNEIELCYNKQDLVAGNEYNLNVQSYLKVLM